MAINLIYDIKDKPAFPKLIVFALQQLLAILAATIAVPGAVMANLAANGATEIPPLSQSAALFGAGVGTLVYLLFTKFKSPVFIGSSFSFIPPMTAAFAGSVSMTAGYLGLIIGSAFAALVYVVLSVLVKIAGVGWIKRIMPAVVVGPTVAIIGLSLAGSAVSQAVSGSNVGGAYVMDLHAIVCFFCGLVTLFVVCISSVYGKKMAKLIPFIIGIVAGYLVASVFTVIGTLTANDALVIIDFSKFASMEWLPDLTFLTAFSGAYEFGEGGFASYLATIAFAYIPVAFVVFAEHLADHTNISSIIGRDLLEDPGLNRTLLGDGIGSFAGAFFGGCPNTTYGESIACVAITGNASTITIFTTAIIAIIASFFGPFVAFLSTIPACVMGGVCITLYGFIAVSGLKMIQGVDLGENRNLFVVSTILICGVGGMALSFGRINISAIACALILGIIVNAVLNRKTKQ